MFSNGYEIYSHWSVNLPTVVDCFLLQPGVILDAYEVLALEVSFRPWRKSQLVGINVFLHFCTKEGVVPT